MDASFTFDVAGFLSQFGSNPFFAMWLIFANGGWILVLIACIWIIVEGWLHWKQKIAGAQKEWVVLAIDIPRVSEKEPGQSLRAVENFFAHLAGAHAPATWTEKWMQGKYQDPISCEIISVEGNVQFVIHCLRSLRDLVEASIFAQYPEAEITEVEDYVNKVPAYYPDEEWDLYGTEIVPAGGNSLYPLRTYPEFEHSMTGELKDPLSVLLEGFSRLGPGEHAWMQLLILPIDQKIYRDEGMTLIKKLKGENTSKPPSKLEKVLFTPFNLFIALANMLIFSGQVSKASAKSDNLMSAKIFNMSPGERKVLEAVENKISKIGYICKIRFLYIAKKNVFKKPKIVQSFIGFIKQMNTNDMLALKPEAKVVGVNGGLWLFNERRNNTRKNKLYSNYKNRSVWYGMPPYYLCTEELATLWHFPHTFQVKAPQVKKRTTKVAEPPMNLPIG